MIFIRGFKHHSAQVRHFYCFCNSRSCLWSVPRFRGSCFSRRGFTLAALLSGSRTLEASWCHRKGLPDSTDHRSGQGAPGHVAVLGVKRLTKNPDVESRADPVGGANGVGMGFSMTRF